jgi:hypothetical protein
MKSSDDVGFIYVLSNPSMPGYLKIGFTRKSDIAERVSELSSSTSVPLPFVLEHWSFTHTPQKYETRLHGLFNKDRVSPKREFFTISLETAIKGINEICYQTTNATEANIQGMTQMFSHGFENPIYFGQKTADGVEKFLNEVLNKVREIRHP